jgi:hypothetical protein
MQLYEPKILLIMVYKNFLGELLTDIAKARSLMLFFL